MAIPMYMGKTRVTSKYQITLPADVRSRMPVHPGETLVVEVSDPSTIIVRRERAVRRPLSVLISRRALLRRHIAPDELDELAESP